MAVHKLSIDNLYEIDYTLIAIHTSLEDYRLAYFINQRLQINLSKGKNEYNTDIKNHFSLFYYSDKDNLVSWNLIQNKNEIYEKEKILNTNLFSDSEEHIKTSWYLIPEIKKADYFLKIDNDENTIEIATILESIKTIKLITATYIVDIKELKSKNNLIF